MGTWVLTPCPGRRLPELLRMLASINADPEHTVIVTTKADPLDGLDLRDAAHHLLTVDKPDLLFGEWMNRGLDYIEAVERAQYVEESGADLEEQPWHWTPEASYEVLMIGSSLTGTPDTIPELHDALRAEWPDFRSLVGPDLHKRLGDHQTLELPLDFPRTVYDRVPPVCMMVAGELGLRFDPQFRWYYSDDDFEMQCRACGTVAIIGGTGVTYPGGHGLSEEQARWAIEDRAKFVQKWQRDPW